MPYQPELKENNNTSFIYKKCANIKSNIPNSTDYNNLMKTF